MEDQTNRGESFSSTSVVLPEAGHPFEILNPCLDFGFKKAFYNPVILIDFLNHILDYQEHQKIIELSYTNTEFPSLAPHERDFRVDSVCKTQNDRYLLVQLQNDYTADYAEKALVEWARFLSRIDGVKIRDLSMPDRKRRRIGQTEVEAQDFWQKIEEVCTLVISNTRHNPGSMKERKVVETVLEPDIINTYEMLNRAHPKRHLGNLEAKVVLVMLANFSKTEDELETVTDRWLFALKDERISTGMVKLEPFKAVQDIAKAAHGREALKQFYAELYSSNIGTDCLTEYVRKIQQTNELLAHEYAEREERGFARGYAEAKREFAEAQRETVKRMQSLGTEDAKICQLLRISAQALSDLMN